jgi:hypothetical protein
MSNGVFMSQYYPYLSVRRNITFYGRVGCPQVIPSPLNNVATTTAIGGRQMIHLINEITLHQMGETEFTDHSNYPANN